MNVQFGGGCCQFGNATTPKFMNAQSAAQPGQLPKPVQPQGGMPQMPLPAAVTPLSFTSSKMQAGRFNTLA